MDKLNQENVWVFQITNGNLRNLTQKRDGRLTISTLDYYWNPPERANVPLGKTQV